MTKTTTRTSTARIIRSVLLITTCLATSPALAGHGGGPTGGTVVGGKARIHHHGDRTVVRQSSDGALINWNDFSVPKGSTVVFKQPDQGSITVNRVVGPNASSIYGDLLANGQIWLINGNGILFGKGSQINVEGLIATTSDIADEDFKKGKYRFSQPSSNPNASVVNVGTITAGRGGSVVLSAPTVVNQGMIQAQLGTVVLGGAKAFTVDMDGDNLIRYQISKPVTETPHDSDGNAQAALVSNSGTVKADGGRVIMTARAARNVRDDVINNSGIVEATSVHSHDGEIDLDAGDNGMVEAGGTLDASGRDAGETGGTVRITGDQVAVENHAQIDASGSQGGGTVLIGGNFHGAGHMRQARQVYVGRGAVINASAVRNGDGGHVAVWSTGTTDVLGHIRAEGGRLGGDGGYVETSGRHLGFGENARVNLGANHGKAGQWLLDPATIDIQNCHGDACTTLSSGQDLLHHDADGTDMIDPSVIENALGNGDVLLEASNQINVYNNLLYSSSNALTLLSEGDITIRADIQNTKISNGGNINLVAGWDGTTENLSQLTNNGVYGNDGGSVTLDASQCECEALVGSRSGTTTVAAYDLELDSELGSAQLGYRGNGGGDISVTLKHDLTLNSVSGSGYAQIGNGDPFTSDASNVTGNITLKVNGTTHLEQNLDSSQDGFVWIGNMAFEGNEDEGAGTETGNVTLVTGNLDVTGDEDGSELPSNPVLGDMITADLTGTFSGEGQTNAVHTNLPGGGSAGGDFTLALTNAGDVHILSNYFADGLYYSSPHALSLLSKDGITIAASIQNSGSGDLNIIGGWNPGVVSANALIQNGVSAVLNTAGAYGGTNGGFVWIAGVNGGLCEDECGEGETFEVASGSGTAVGSKSGTTTVAGGQIYVESFDVYSQIGYHGKGTGAINVFANSSTAPAPPDGGTDACFEAGGSICLIGSRPDYEYDGAFSQIGDTATGNGGVNITVKATGNITVAGGGIYCPECSNDASDTYGLIGNGDPLAFMSGGGGGGHVHELPPVSNVSGDILVEAGGQLEILGSEDPSSPGWIGNVTANGNASGDVTLVMGTESDNGAHTLADIIIADLGTSANTGGDVTVGITDPDNNNFHSGLDYNSPHTLSLLSTGDIVIANTLSNSGSGDINLVAGWDGETLETAHLMDAGVYGNDNGSVTIGGENGGDTVFVGSKSGTTTVAADDVTVDAANGVAVLGYMGQSASGNVNVLATGNVLVEAETQHGIAQIGDYIFGETGARPRHHSDEVASGTGGDVSITTQGGSVIVEALDDGSIATVGTIGNQDTSQSGDVTIQTNGGALKVLGMGNPSENGISVAHIGNMVFGQTNGTTTGDIDIDAGAITVKSGGDSSHATIGQGVGTAFGSASGDISITGTSLLVQDAGSNGRAQIGNLASADVGGTLTFEISGDVTAKALGASSIAYIGNSCACAGSGTISLTAGGDILLFSDTGVGGGGARLGNSGSGDITVSGDNITLDAESGFALIGNLGVGNFGGDITVTADGALVMKAVGDDTTAQIGNSENGDVSTVTGDVSVTAQSVSATASGTDAIAELGNTGWFSDGDSITGDVTVNTTGGSVVLAALGDGSVAQIGNVDTGSSSVSGDVSVNTSGGALSLSATGGADSDGDASHALIGNLVFNDPSGSASGDLNVSAGNITLNDTGDAGQTLIGNQADSISGDVTVTGTKLTGGDIGNSIANDLNGGDFALTLTSNHALTIGSDFDYSSSHNVTVKNGGDILIEGDLLNAGDGAIKITSGGALTAVGSVGAGSVTMISSDDMSVAAIHASSGDIDLTSGGKLGVTGTLQASGSGAIDLGSHNDMMIGGSIKSGSGDITLDSGDGLVIASSVSSTGGDIDVSAKHDVTIGGSDASGDVFVGSKHGDTTVSARNVLLDAKHGFAQLGYNGSASGDIAINAKGDVTLKGGGNGDFAQVGNGGYGTSGNETGDILINAKGDVSLLGGTGNDAYVQVGNGGSHANKHKHGYTNSGDITIKGNNFLMTGGHGNGAYVQVGNGGYLVGQTLTGGVAKNVGDIAITANGTVLTVKAGAGNDAYAQVGNGGDRVNENADNSASGQNSGNLTVTLVNSNGHDVTLIAGAGSNAYSQVGNGGFGNNTSSSNNVNFADGGNISISDLIVQGGDGDNGYAQVGNGDNASSGHANVSGDITISSGGDVTVTDGGKGHAGIGNATGVGTVSGTVTGYSSGTPIDDTNTGTISTLVQTSTVKTTITTTTRPEGTDTLLTPGDQDTSTDNPLGELAGGDGDVQDSDSVTDSIAHKKTVVSTTLIPGLLRQNIIVGANQPHGVPSADQDYSSWGNEALWRW